MILGDMHMAVSVVKEKGSACWKTAQCSTTPDKTEKGRERQGERVMRKTEGSGDMFEMLW